jgi:hypothetical protein
MLHHGIGLIDYSKHRAFRRQVMEYRAVSSSNLAAVAYDKDTSTLGIQFVKGTEYHYSGVPLSVYQALMSTPSKGQYFNAHIKDRYTSTRIN